MAIDTLYLHCLRKAIEHRRGGTDARLRALLLAYPELLVPRATLVSMLGEKALEGVAQRADAGEVYQFHGLAGVSEPLYDTLGVLANIGLETLVIDVARLRGMERIVDLNEPLPRDLAQQFDLVVDTGTCEHCFNVGQAFMNACEALAAGGVLVHAAPLTRLNHGFWSFNPTVYPDFFEDNGFELQRLTGVVGNIREGFKPFDVEPFRNFAAPPNAALLVVAQRREVRPLKWPVQRKYREMLK